MPITAYLLAKSVEVEFGSGRASEQIHLGFMENVDKMRVMFLMGDREERRVRFGVREGKFDHVAVASVRQAGEFECRVERPGLDS